MKGRIIFGIIGFLLFKIPGLILGLILGYILVDKKAGDRFKNQNNPEYVRSLIEFHFELMGYVARSAGRINEEHIAIANQYMDLMRLDDSGRVLARAAFTRGKSGSFGIDDSIRSHLSVIGRNMELINYLLEAQIQVALSDGVLEESERSCLISLAIKMGVSATSMENLINRRYQEMKFKSGYYQGGYSYGQGSGGYDYGSSQSGSSESSYDSQPDRLQAAYDLLGVLPSASDAEIKKAHKKMMLKYHPDRLASQGLSAEMVRLYTEKAKDIQAAFDLIKKARGIH